MLEVIQNPYVVRATIYGRQKYWTGAMMGRFPEYLTNPRRARKVTKAGADAMVTEFKELLPVVTWEAVPAAQAVAL